MKDAFGARSLAVVSLLSVLGIAVGCGSSTPAQTTSPASQVQVINTAAQAVPVTGNVNATVSGTPTVNVGNAPTVNIGNAPTVNVGSMPAVTINPPSLTVVSNMDDPGRNPYQSVATTSSCTGTTCVLNFGSVPAGHRLVLLHASAGLDFSSTSTTTPALVFVNIGTDPLNAVTHFPVTDINGNAGVFDKQILLYIDGSQTVQLAIFLSGGNFVSGQFQNATLFGYLVDCSAAPCAPIAH